MTDRHRLESHKRGRPYKIFKKSDKRKHKALGGIPVKITKTRKIKYVQIISKNYNIKRERGGEQIYFDSESEERRDSILPTGDGDFIRRHIYEMKFNIRSEESNDERRKREYLEWWEEQ